MPGILVAGVYRVRGGRGNTWVWAGGTAWLWGGRVVWVHKELGGGVVWGWEERGDVETGLR